MNATDKAIRSTGSALITTLALTGCGRPPVPPQAPSYLASAAVEQVKARYPDAVEVHEALRGLSYDEDAFKRWDIELEAGRCYYFSGVADRVTAEELELALYDATDDELEDEDADDPPHVLMEYCPETTATVYLQARIPDGAGHYHIEVYGKPNAAPPPPPEPPPPPPAPVVDLDARVASLAASAAAGAERVGDLYRGTADYTDWYVALEAGKCYWFVGAGDDDVDELYLYLWNPEDDRITQSKPESREVSIGHCPKVSGMHRFQAKVGSGSGAYAVGLYKK